ncbi:FxSxx-COOH cyclophane-containing RiPP peptide [Streptomyces sp. NPDC002308]
MKINATTLSFAAAKKSRTPLVEIDARGAEASRKFDRVFGSSEGRATQASTFSSAL